jgi:hypothetical protein
MYNYSTSEAGQSLPIQNSLLNNSYENIQIQNKNRKLKKCLIAFAISTGIVVAFVAGYLVRNYFPNDDINNFLNNNQNSPKNITERIIDKIT